MSDVKENSSLPLLLTITGAVVVVVLGGWFFLNRETADPVQEERPAPQVAAAETGPDIVDEPVEEPSTENEAMAASPAGVAGSMDAELRKARLAADADILVLPASQSALYYYGRVLEAEPGHAIAAAELDAILTRIDQDVSELLENEQYLDAYEIAVLVAEQAPEHESVLATQSALDAYTESLVEDAIASAQSGDDKRANDLLAEVESLPDRNPEYIEAVRDSLEEIREVRVAAERDRAQRAILADNEARVAWTTQVRAAIEAGNLVTPAGASALDLLGEENSWDAEREELTAEFVVALLAALETRIGAGELETAESLLAVAEELAPDNGDIAPLRVRLDDAFIDAQSARVVSTRDLTYVTTAAPRYPKRAVQREMSGWVFVEFTITPGGATRDIEVTESDPAKIFDRAAMEAVEKWEFEPVVYRGQAINQRAGARLVFSID
jgi:TonB family protein